MPPEVLAGEFSIDDSFDRWLFEQHMLDPEPDIFTQESYHSQGMNIHGLAHDVHYPGNDNNRSRAT